MAAASPIGCAGPSSAPATWLSRAAAPRRSSGDRATKARRPLAPMIRISSGPERTAPSLAATGCTVSQPSPIASSRINPDRGQDRDTTIRLSAGGLGRNGLGPGAAEGAGHPVHQDVVVAEAVGVVAPEPAGGPTQHEGSNILGPGQEVIVADLMHTGWLHIPLVRCAGQRLLHELVPNGGGADDTGGVVAERSVVRIPNPHRGRERRGIADRPVIAEGLRGPRLGRHVAARQRQVAMAAELQAAVAVVGHDRADDVRDLRADRPVFILCRVVAEDVVAGW